MKRDLSLWQFAGFALTGLGGTLLHFLYDWTNQSILIAPFSGVNESTWEHMKLLYFPTLIFALVQSRFFKSYENFWCIKFWGLLAGLIAIPTIFYTYNGAIGKSPDWLNIAIFFISAACAYIYEARLFRKSALTCKNPSLAVVLLVFLALCFTVFTFTAPKAGIFRDPLTGNYGI